MGNSLMLPGIRFHPTDDELVVCYLKKKLLGKKLDPPIVAEINIYDFEPWELSAKSILSGDRKKYFFCPTSKKYLNGPRKNRKTKAGYWKGTGKDKEVKHKGKTVAMRKTLIFYESHPTKGTRTNWVLHEYRMTDDDLTKQGVDQAAYVVCKVFEKSGLGPKNGEQYGAAFELKEENDDDEEKSTITSTMMVGVLVNPKNVSGSSGVNITSTEAGPSTVTYSTVVDPDASTSGPSTLIYQENERFTDVPVNNNTQEVEDRKGKKVMTVSVNEKVFPVKDDIYLWLQKMLDPNSSTSGPSTLMNQNERLTDVPVNKTTQEVEDRKGKKVMTDPLDENDVPVNDDDMLTNADMDLLFHDDDTQKVEDPKGKKVMTDPVNENDGILDELMVLSNKDLGQDDFNMFWIDENDASKMFNINEFSDYSWDATLIDYDLQELLKEIYG